MKTCSNNGCQHLGVPQDESEFHKDTYQSDGLSCRCRTCKHQYYLENKARIQKRDLPKKDLKNAYNREYYRENRFKLLENNRRYAEEHPERMKEYSRRYNLSEKGAVRRRRGERKRRSIIKGVCDYTFDDEKRLLDLFNYKCVICGKDLHDEYHLDHMIPLSRGGTDTLNNLLPMCPRCNRRKWVIPLGEFLYKMEAINGN